MQPVFKNTLLEKYYKRKLFPKSEIGTSQLLTDLAVEAVVGP